MNNSFSRAVPSLGHGKGKIATNVSSYFVKHYITNKNSLLNSGMHKCHAKIIVLHRGLNYSSSDLLRAHTIMWLLHPSPRANGNYASLRIIMCPSNCIMLPSGCLDLRSTASLWQHNAILGSHNGSFGRHNFHCHSGRGAVISHYSGL